MSKKQSDSHLKYGQGILVQGYKTQTGEDIGLLTAKGFADSQAKYQTYGNILYFKNYRNAIFQIIPAGNFQINDELRKIVENNNQQTPNVKILKARAKSQENQFELNITNKNKDLICFGYDVIFKHIDSGTYLSGTIRPSSGTNGAFSVEVTKNLSESLIFSLLPFRSFEKLGMPIPMDSPILIKNKFNNGYLTFQKIGVENLKSGKKIDLDKKPIVADDTYRLPVKTNSAQSEIFDTVTHFVDLSQDKKEVPMPWQFVLHVNEVENDSLIQHDIVYFQHTANGGVLSTAGTEIVLKQLKAENASELKFYECLWQIETYEEKGQHCFILRHLMSGMSLGIEKSKEQGQEFATAKRPILIDISQGQSDGALQNGYVQLKLAKKQGGIINSQSFINIVWGQSCLDIKKQNLHKDQENQEEGDEELFPKAKLAHMALSQQQYDIKKLEFTLDISKHCFVIQEIDDQLKKKVLFALSFHSKIIDLREDLKWGPEQAEKKVSYFRMMQVTEKIKQIKDFLKNCSRQQSDLQHIHPLEMQQMICKDLGISELLFELLFYMKQNLKKTPQQQHPIFQTKHNEHEKFIELYNTIYQVITELIRDNQMFKIHVSKWIMFILDDVINKNQQSQQNLIKQLLKNNQFIINNFVTERLVQYLSHNMIDKAGSYIFYQKKYIEIFRLFCIVGGKVNTENQIKVLNHFIKQLRIKEKGPTYQINLSKKDQVVFTQAAIDKNIAKKRRFGDYYKICKEQYESAWFYFVEYLNLIADMTKGRNKTVQSYIETMMTLDVLSELFETYELHEAQVPVIRLLHYLYAESQRFYPIERKKRIVDYQKLAQEEITVLSTTSQIKPWNPPINRVLNCLMKKLKQFQSIVPSQIQKNMNLYHILDFIWQTLNLGFWQNKEQVRSILEDILKILEPHKNINYEQAKIQSKQNVLMIQCKLQCMNIIQVILDYDVDLAVRYLCKHFQNFNMPSRSKKKIEVTKIMEEKIEDQLAKRFISSFPNDQQPLVSTKIIRQMIQLSNYNNPSLTSQSISIIERTLLSQSKALENFYQQIFVCGDERKKLTEFIQERKRKFFTLQDQTLTNVSMKNQEGNYVIVHRDDKDSGIMQDLFMIGQLIRFQNSVLNIRQVPTLDNSKSYNQLGTKKLINFTSERTSSDIMKQNVLNAQNIHWKVLQYILNCREIPTEDLALKLLHLSYRFLVGLIWNYQDIKLQLIPYIPQVCHHINKNVGCIDFLREMFDNNKNILFNEADITRLIKDICNVMQNEPQDSFYKSKLLDFFRFLIYCNGKSLKFNQIQILKIMQDDSFTKIILKVDLAEIKGLVTKYIQDNKQKEDKLSHVVKMDPKLVYYCSYFQILQSLIDDQNQVNMGKLLKKFPFDFLVNCIKVSRTCWPLKRNIRAFLNRLYYFQPEIETYMKTIINQQVENIIQDLNYYIEIKCKSNVQQYENQVFENPVRFTYIESYLYLNLQENLFTLYELTTRKVIQQEMKNFLHSLNSQNNDGPYNFIRLCQRLGFIKNYFSDKKNVYTNSFIKFLLSKFREIIKQFDDSIYLPGMNSFSGMNRAPTKPEKETARKYLIEKIMQGEISTFYVQGTGEYDKVLPLVYQIPDKMLSSKEDKKPNQDKLIKKLKEILRRQKKEFKNKDEQIQYKMTRIVTAIKLSPSAGEMLNTDYNNKLQPYSSQESIFNYITIIIEMNSLNPQALPQNEKKFFLQLITGIVEQNNKTVMQESFKPLDQWQADDWKSSRQQIQLIQVKLKNCGLGKFITQLLKQNICENIQFANAILLCGISYMLGGNNITQKNIIQQMDSDGLNKVMKNVDLLIAKLGKFILKNIDDGSTKEQGQNTFSTTTIDNYDFYDTSCKYVLRQNVFEPITTDEQIYYKKCVITYRRAFKFLQLLCENNNIEGKNFIREQPRKVRQANFINITTKQLRNLFQVMSYDIADVPMFLLDFLLEVTQIPVKSNQEALMSLTFFEDLCQMENFFSKEGNIEKRGFENQPELLDAVYFKSIEIILSNFQGNELKTFEAVDSKLQPKFLINILKSKLSHMNIKTKEDMLIYIEKENYMTFNEDMMAILNIIMIFLKLEQNLGEQGSRVFMSYAKERSDNQKLYQYIESLLINIEISDEYNKLQTVLFPRFPVFDSLSSNLRDYVMGAVQRGSHRDKIVSLMGYTRGIQDKIEMSYRLQKTQNISQKNMNTSFNLSAVMSIVLCVYMMRFYDVIIQFGEAEFVSGRLIGLGRFFLSLVQLSMTCVYAYYWYKLRIWEKPQRKSRENSETPAFSFEEENVEEKGGASPSKLAFVYNAIDTVKSNLGLTGGDPDATKIYQSADFYRLALYLGISFLGTFFHPPLFFIHIIDIFCNNPDLGNIFAAIALSIKSILYVSFLGIVFVFIFCTVTFSNYMKDVYSQGESEADMCQSIFDCLMQLFVSGAIGETMAQFEIFRFTYDMIYITFFGLLFGNIVSGIMLDAFASLRSHNEELLTDKKNTCYICNISREELEQKGISFVEHTMNKHFLWNYVFYIYSLEKKSQTDYTGLEYYISTRYNRPDEEVDVGWVPLGGEGDFDSTEKLKELIGQVDQQNKKIQGSIVEIESRISEFNEIALEYV